MSTSDQSTVLGVVVLARHGDRQGFYQDPETYTASATAITPLGEVRYPSFSVSPNAFLSDTFALRP